MQVKGISDLRPLATWMVAVTCSHAVHQQQMILLPISTETNNNQHLAK